MHEDEMRKTLYNCFHGRTIYGIEKKKKQRKSLEGNKGVAGLLVLEISTSFGCLPPHALRNSNYYIWVIIIHLCYKKKVSKPGKKITKNFQVFKVNLLNHFYLCFSSKIAPSKILRNNFRNSKIQ